MPLKIQINPKDLADELKEFAQEAEKDIRTAFHRLAPMTHAKAGELAKASLMKSGAKSNIRLGIYMDNLGWEQTSENVDVVYLGEPALWIEEGREAGDMKPGLLKGAKFKRIPFRYDMIPSQRTEFTQNMVKLIEKGISQENATRKRLGQAPLPFNARNYKKVEQTTYDANGNSPRLHRFNFASPIPGKGNTPALSGLSIYQRKDSKTGNIKRDILTFRTVSSGPASAGKWMYPGSTAKKFMDEAMDWAMNEWENVILPEVMNKWGK